MFTFNESNVCTLESDLLERLELPENFVVAQMYYKPGSNEVYCEVRKLTPCANKFLTLDGYTVTVETGSEGGDFSIQDVVCDGWRGDFSQHVAKFRPGYELQLVREDLTDEEIEDLPFDGCDLCECDPCQCDNIADENALNKACENEVDEW